MPSKLLTLHDKALLASEIVAQLSLPQNKHYERKEMVILNVLSKYAMKEQS